MEVTLLGTGDTTGTPTPGCNCDTCTRARELGVERSRFSVHVHNPRTDRSLLVDASPDFRHQILHRDVPLPDEILITHVHFDHLDGLGNAYRLLSDAPVYAADVTDPETDESVAETVARKYDYLDAVTVEPQSPDELFRACGFRVRLLPVVHPPLACYGVAITDPTTGAKLAISGDTAYDVPEHTWTGLADPDLFLGDGIVPAHLCDYHPRGGRDHDADGVARTFGTKHMTVEGALDMGGRLGADETRVAHVSHFVPPDEAFDEPLAVDGEQYEL